MTIIVANIIKKFKGTIVLIEKKFLNANISQSVLFVESAMTNLSTIMQANAWPVHLAPYSIFMISLVLRFPENQLTVVEKVKFASRDNVLPPIFVPM